MVVHWILYTKNLSTHIHRMMPLEIYLHPRQGNQNDVDPWDVDYEIMATIDPVIWEFMNVNSGFTINPNKHLHRDVGRGRRLNS